MNDKLRTFYDRLNEDGYGLPDYDRFRVSLSDEGKFNKFRERLIEDGYKLPDAEAMQLSFGLKKKEESVSEYPSQEKDTRSESYFELFKETAPPQVFAAESVRQPTPQGLPEIEPEESENIPKPTYRIPTLSDVVEQATTPKLYDMLDQGRPPEMTPSQVIEREVETLTQSSPEIEERKKVQDELAKIMDKGKQHDPMMMTRYYSSSNLSKAERERKRELEQELSRLDEAIGEQEDKIRQDLIEARKQREESFISSKEKETDLVLKLDNLESLVNSLNRDAQAIKQKKQQGTLTEEEADEYNSRVEEYESLTKEYRESLTEYAKDAEQLAFLDGKITKIQDDIRANFTDEMRTAGASLALGLIGFAESIGGALRWLGEKDSDPVSGLGKRVIGENITSWAERISKPYQDYTAPIQEDLGDFDWSHFGDARFWNTNALTMMASSLPYMVTGHIGGIAGRMIGGRLVAGLGLTKNAAKVGRFFVPGIIGSGLSSPVMALSYGGQTFNQSLELQMERAGVSEPTEEMRREASRGAQRTFYEVLGQALVTNTLQLSAAYGKAPWSKFVKKGNKYLVGTGRNAFVIGEQGFEEWYQEYRTYRNSRHFSGEDYLPFGDWRRTPEGKMIFSGGVLGGAMHAGIAYGGRMVADSFSGENRNAALLRERTANIFTAHQALLGADNIDLDIAIEQAVQSGELERSEGDQIKQRVNELAEDPSFQKIKDAGEPTIQIVKRLNALSTLEQEAQALPADSDERKSIEMVADEIRSEINEITESFVLSGRNVKIIEEGGELSAYVDGKVVPINQLTGDQKSFYDATKKLYDAEHEAMTADPEPTYYLDGKYYDTKEQFIEAARKVKGEDALEVMDGMVTDDPATYNEASEIMRQNREEAGLETVVNPVSEKQIGLEQEMKESGLPSPPDVKATEKGFEITRKGRQDRRQIESPQQLEEYKKEIEEEQAGIEQTLSKRDDAKKSADPYRIFDQTFSTKEEFIAGLREATKKGIDPRAILSDDIQPGDVAMSEVLEIVNEAEIVAEPSSEVASTEELRMRQEANQKILAANLGQFVSSEVATKAPVEQAQETAARLDAEPGKKPPPGDPPPGDPPPGDLESDKPKPGKSSPKSKLIVKVRDLGKEFRRGKRIGKDEVAKDRERIKKFVNENQGQLNESVKGRAVSALIRKINNADTQGKVRQAIDYMERLLVDDAFKTEENRKEQWRDKIKKILSDKKYFKKESHRLKAKGVDYDAYNTIKQLQRVFINDEVIDATEARDQIRVIEERAFDEQRLLTDDEVRVKEILELGLIDEMTSRDVEKVHDAIESFVKNEKSKFRQQLDETRVKNKALKEYVGKIIANKRIAKAFGEAYVRREVKKIEKLAEQEERMLTPEEEARIADLEANMRPEEAMNAKNVRAFLDSPKNSSWFSLLDVLSRNDTQMGKIYKTRLHELFAMPVMDAEQAYSSGVRQETRGMIDKRSEIFGIKEGETVGHEKRMKEVHEIHYTENGKEKSIKLSQNQAYYLYQKFQDPTLESTLKIDYPQEKREAIENFLDEDVKAWADWQLNESYPQLYQKYNEAYRKMFGRDMPLNDRYSPLFREVEGATEMDMFEKTSPFQTANDRATKERVGSTKPIKIMDGDNVLINYIDKMEHFASHGEMVRNLNLVFGDSEVRKNIKLNFGKAYDEVIQDFIGRFAKMQRDKGRTWKWLDNLRTRTYPATLALKPIIAIKQLSSIPAYAQFIPTADFITGTAKFFKNPVKNWQMLMDSSEMLKHRYEVGWDRDLLLDMKKDFERLNSAESRMMRLRNSSMFLVKWGDRAAIIMGGYSVYNHHYNENKHLGHDEAHRKAIREFEYATRLSQQSSQTADLSYWQTNSSMTQAMTMYMNAPAQYLRTAFAGTRRLIKWQNPRDGARALVISHLVLPSIFQFLGNGFKWNWKDQTQAAVLGNLNTLMWGGKALEYMYSSITDNVKSYGRGFEFTPIEGAITDLGKTTAPRTWEYVRDVIDGIEEFDIWEVMAIGDKIFRAGAPFAGVPYPAISNTVKAGYDIATGQTDEPLRRALGWSEWALDRGLPLGAYFDRHKMALELMDDEVAEFYQTGVDVNEYLAIKQERDIEDEPWSRSKISSHAKKFQAYHVHDVLDRDVMNDVNELLSGKNNSDKLKYLVRRRKDFKSEDAFRRDVMDNYSRELGEYLSINEQGEIDSYPITPILSSNLYDLYMEWYEK